MKNKKHQNKDNLLSTIRNRIDKPISLHDGRIDSHEVAVLLGELQIAQLELEMQNDELFVSSQLLETERSKFEELFNLAPIGYFILDKLGVIEDFNKIGAHLLNISKSKAIKKRFQSFVAPEDWENFYAFLHSMQHTDLKQSKDIKLLLNDGTFFYTLIEGIKTKSKYHDQIQYYITVTDVSESKLAQQKLLETAQRLEMTLSASGTGTWTLDSENQKINIDDFCYSLLGIKPWQFNGTIKGFISVIHPDDQQKVRQILINGVKSSLYIEFEFRVLSDDGTLRAFSVKGKEIRNDNQHNFFAGILVDITLKKALADETLRRQEERQRLIFSTTFSVQEKERQKISTALHDSVCQLLYGIKLNLQGIQHTQNLKDEFKNMNQLLDQAISETRELSYDLTPSVLRDFGFSAGVKEIAQRFSTSKFRIRTNIKNTINLLEPNLQLFVFRIMQELINNCIKHSKASIAEIKVSTEDENVTLIVTDNGKGFDNSLESSLINGSGLRGIKNRVFLIDGSIDIQSSGVGTNVIVKLRKDLTLPGFNI